MLAAHLEILMMGSASIGKLISLNPRFSEARNNLAMAYIDAGQPEAAERELRLLLRDQPSWYQAAFTLANLLRDNKRYLEAIEAFRFCLEHAPVYADAWNNLGLTYAALKKMDEAMASYRQALSINADFKPSRQNLAQALIQQKRHSDALEQFEIFCSLADLTPMEQVVAFQGRITCLTELDQIEEGLRVADGAFGDERLRLIARLHVLPVLYRDNQQVLDVRNRWAGDAKQLYEQLDGISIDDSAWPLLYAHAWSLTNFILLIRWTMTALCRSFMQAYLIESCDRSLENSCSLLSNVNPTIFHH